MTSPNSAAALPLAATVAADLVDTDDQPDSGPTVGASDADADAARSGADVDLTNATRDSDGTPVGEDDRDADAQRFQTDEN